MTRIKSVLHADWTAMLRNIRREKQVWGRLGELLRREGEDLILSKKFYQAVVQVVLLSGDETWVLLEAML